MTGDGEYSDVSALTVASAIAHLRKNFPPAPEALMQVSVSWVSQRSGVSSLTITVSDNEWPGDDDDDDDTDEFEDEDDE